MTKASWTLGTLTMDGENVGPVQSVEDGRCVRCEDTYSSMHLVEGECFQCAYGANLRTGKSLDHRFQLGVL